MVVKKIASYTKKMKKRYLETKGCGEFGGAGGTIQRIATEKNIFELLIRIKDIDLFNKETVVHPNYHKFFIKALHAGDLQIPIMPKTRVILN